MKPMPKCHIEGGKGSKMCKKVSRIILMDRYVYFPTFQTNEADAPEPVDATDFKKDVAVIFWSSGTTGEIFD